MEANRKICTIVGSDKGGVGKSMVSLVKTLVFDHANVPLSVIELDNQRKLSTVLGQRVNLSLAAAADLKEISRNRHAAEFFYNPVYEVWSKGTSLTDLGANVTASLLAWFRQCDIGELAAEDNIHFRFASCASPDEQAIKSSLEAAKEAIATLGPSAEIYVILNDTAGTTGFGPYASNPAMLEIRALQRAGKVSVLEMPYCNSLLLDYGKAKGLTPVDTIRRSDEVAKSAGLDVVATRVHKKLLMAWLKDVQNALEPLLTVEESIQQPVAAPAGNART